MNVQRLESEDVYPITSPRVPGNFIGKKIMFSFPSDVPKPQPPEPVTVVGTVPPIQKQQIGQSRRILRSYKNQLKLSESQFDTSIGLMLGDASLQTQDGGKSYRLKFEVGDRNREYLTHIKSVFNDYILQEPRLTVRTNKNENQVSTWQLETVSHTEFSKLADILLNANRKKYIKPELIQEYLTERGLAYWFMDDGGKLDYGPNEGKGFVLNTQGFVEQDVHYLAEGLEQKFGLQTWVKPNKNGYVVAISGQDYEKFLALIDPYLIQSMRHKIPTPRKTK